MTDASYTPARYTGGGYTGADLREAQFGDYIELLKPRVMRLVVFTALVGMVAAPGGIHPVIGLASLVCIAVGAGAAGALNMWWDRDIDAVMRRTAARPIPSGLIGPDETLAIGLTLAGFSVVMLGLFANPGAALLLAFTIFFYIAIYSAWLKRSTPQNIVIGGAAGAFPPMIGWACATGTVSVESVLMFLVIFLWTPPHFWALALFRNDDYARAGVPMLPVAAGGRATRNQILGYTLVLVPVALALGVSGVGGPIYTLGATILSAMFVAGGWRLWRRDEAAAVADRYREEKRVFGFSILYLFLIFGLLLVEAVLRHLGFGLEGWPVLV
jgi:protoheme IX farnesyltransferase